MKKQIMQVLTKTRYHLFPYFMQPRLQNIARVTQVRKFYRSDYSGEPMQHIAGYSRFFATTFDVAGLVGEIETLDKPDVELGDLCLIEYQRHRDNNKKTARVTKIIKVNQTKL